MILNHQAGAKMTFPKSEKLCSPKLIEAIFKSPHSRFQFPFKIFYMFGDIEGSPRQILFTVPKRNFKKAVDRNEIKRRLREAYRKNKSLLFQEDSTSKISFIAIVYLAKDKFSYFDIEKKLIFSLLRLNAE